MQANAILKCLKKNWGLTLIFMLYFAVKLYQLTRLHFLIWDEAVYVSMGKWLFSGGHLGLYEIIRPIAFPLVLGAVWRLGLPVVVVGEALQILFGAGIIWLTYSLGKTIFNRQTGIVAALIVSITPVFFLYSNYLLVDTTSTFFVLLAMHFFLKQKYFLSGIIAGIAFLTRFPQGLILVVLLSALGLMLVTQRNLRTIKHGLSLTAGFVLVCIPFFIFNYFVNRFETSAVNAIFRPMILAFSHQSNPFEAIAGGGLYQTLYYFIVLISQNWMLALFLIGLLIVLLRGLYKKQGVQLLLVWLGIYIAYYSYIVNKQERFANAFLPGLCILAGYGAYWLYNWLSRKRIVKKAFVTAIFAVGLLLLSIPAIKLDATYCSYRSGTPNPIVQDFYMYFQHNPTDKAILTADPVPAAYSDARFIPAVRDIPTAIKIIGEYSKQEDVGWLIFKLSSYPCLEGDNACLGEQKQLVSIVKANTLVYNKSFFGEPYLIYRIDH
jgi:hypothetical protein